MESTEPTVSETGGTTRTNHTWRWAIGLALIGLWIRVEIGLRESRSALAADVQQASYTFKLNEDAAIRRIADAISKVRQMPADVEEALRTARLAMEDAERARSQAESANYKAREASESATHAQEEADEASRLANSALLEAISARRQAESAEGAAGSAMSEALDTKRALSPSPFDMFRRR